MSLAESQRFYFDLCAKPETIKGLQKSAPTMLKKYYRSQKDREFLAHYPVERYHVYRNHISVGFLGGIEDVFPITRSLVTKEAWNELLNDFYSKRLTRSPLARHVFDEFSTYLQNYEGPLLKRLPYLNELAEYERLELRLIFSKDKPMNVAHMTVVPKDPLTLIPILNPHLVRRVYQWPVHRISKHYWKPIEIEKGHYPLIIYRHPETLRVTFIEGNVLFANLIEAMKPGRKSIRRILNDLVRKYHVSQDKKETFIQEGILIIVELRQQGVIIGMKNSGRRKR